MCGNGTDRTQHPAELFGDDWYEWGLSEDENAAAEKTSAIREELNKNDKS